MEFRSILTISLIFNMILFVVAISTITFLLVKKRKKNEQHREIVVPESYLMDLDGVIGKKMFPITKSVITIGRADNVDLYIEGGTVSSTHAQISYRDHAFYLVDMGSTNGTYLNGSGERINSEVIIKSGDIISFDKYKFKFSIQNQNMSKRGEIDRAKIQKLPINPPINKETHDIKEMSDKTDQDLTVPTAFMIDLSGVTGKDRFEINKKITKIGRSKGNDVDICISKNTISSLHAQIEYKSEGFYLSDLNSTNGTYINEERQRITSKVKLKGNEIIYFDTFKFRFSLQK